MKLKISEDISLPTDAVTQTFAILAKRGTGKTYTASVLAEEMLKANQQIVALDPTGAWWGLRSGYKVVIFGGEHADVPLEESAGEVVAQAIVEHGFSAVIDLSLFRKGQMIRFMVAFAETLYRLNRAPLHLFVDEADAVAPQAKNYGGDENRMLGAMEDIVRRGRKRGIGCTLITQRPAVINKNVLTQCEVLVALRLVHPKDIGAIEEWVNVHGDPAVAETMIQSLPSLPIGTAWIWAPGWGDIFKRVAIRQRETFDSGATPKPGEKQQRPKSLEEIDLSVLGEQIKATVERSKENNPAELKRTVAELKRKLAAAEKAAPEPKQERVEVPILDDAAKRLLEKIQHAIEAEQERAIHYKHLAQQLSEIQGQIHVLISNADRRALAAPKPALFREVKRILHSPKPAAAAESNGELDNAQQKIIDTIAMLNARGLSPNREMVARWLDIHPNGGRYGSNLAHLRAEGYIVDFDLVDGKASPHPVETGIEGCLEPLDGTQREIVQLLADNNSVAYTRETLAEALGKHPNGGRYGSDLARLRTMGIIPSRGDIKLTPEAYQ